MEANGDIYVSRIIPSRFRAAAIAYALRFDLLRITKAVYPGICAAHHELSIVRGMKEKDRRAYIDMRALFFADLIESLEKTDLYAITQAQQSIDHLKRYSQG